MNTFITGLKIIIMITVPSRTVSSDMKISACASNTTITAKSSISNQPMPQYIHG